MKLSDYVDVLHGKLVSDSDFEILEFCTSRSEKKFLTFLENPQFINKISSNTTCIITTSELEKDIPHHISGIFIAEEPHKEFVLLHNFLAENQDYIGESFETQFGSDCEISPLACIASKNVYIGSNVRIAPYVVINENVYIGDNCNICENSVIGGKSFNYIRTADGQMVGMKDCGKVVLEEGVEICPNCHVASCPLPTDTTKLEKNVKLDAFVHIGHGSRIGMGTLIPAGAKIAGNVDIGKNAWIGVNATIANRIIIEDGGRVSLGAVVTKDVPSNQTVTGNFAIEHKKFIENLKEQIHK